MLELYLQKKITSTTFNKILFLIHSFLIRRAICDIDTKGITNIFPSILGNVIDDCVDGYSNIFEIIKKHLINKSINKNARMPTDKELTNAIQNVNVYSHLVPLKIVLLKIETKHGGNILDESKINIEHIAPQRPTKIWLKEFNNDKQKYESLVNTMGNLTIVASWDNSSMGNDFFTLKQKILKNQNHIKLNKWFENLKKWNEEEILKRSKYLADQIIDLYPYQLSNLQENAIEIEIKWENKIAKAWYYKNSGDVEIQSGSQISDIYLNEWKENENFSKIFKELQDDNIIVMKNGIYMFESNYVFRSKKEGQTALSSSASFLMCKNRTGSSYWKDLNGNKIIKDYEEWNHKRDEINNDDINSYQISNNIIALWAKFEELLKRVNNFSYHYVQENFKKINLLRISDLLEKIDLTEIELDFIHEFRKKRNIIDHSKEPNPDISLGENELEMYFKIIKKIEKYLSDN